VQELKNCGWNRFWRAVLAVLLAAAVVLTSGLQMSFAVYADGFDEQEAAEVLIPEDAGEGYIVKLKEERTSAEDAALNDALAQDENLTVLSYTEDTLAAEDAETVQGMDADAIEYVEANHPVVLSAVADSGAVWNDPHYAEQYYLDRMHVPAEQLTEESLKEAAGGANPPVVAVIDSGLYTEHEDIDAARVLPGKYFGRQEVTDDTSDVIGHGTAVTGLLMATCNNGLGIAGLTQGVKVMPLRVVDEDGSCTEKQVIEAIHYAVQQKTAYDDDPSQGANIQVINMSLEVAVQEGEPSPKALQEACREAMDAGILVICAGGNGGSAATYPAQYTLGVGATGYEEGTGDIHAAESRLLSEANGEGYENKIWVCAPGVDITTTSCTDGSAYTTITGTSAAAPQVAALAALCKWIDPSLDQAAFKTLLKEHAQPLSGASGKIGSQDVEFGYGLVDYEQVLSSLGMVYGNTDDPETNSDSVQEDGGAGTEPPAAQSTTSAMAVTGPADDPENPVNDNTKEKETPAVIETAEFPGSNVQLQTGPYYMGIDVSYWDGEVIDWTKVRNAGVRFVFVRVGYASLGSGKLNEDYMFISNIQGAYNAGINVGVYFYSQATTPAEAKAEANYMISRIEPYRNYITLPLVMDMESPETYNGSTTYWARANVSKAQVAINYLAFADVVNKAGYVPMFYTYTSWITQNLGGSMSVINNSGYPVWLAEYPSTVGEKPPLFAKLYGAIYKYDFWQYSSTGRISGISTNVDCNRWYSTDLFKYDRRYHWVKDAGGWRCYNSDNEQVVSGFGHDSQGWAWMNADGYWEEYTGWVESDGEWYYVEDGYRLANCWLSDSNGWCYAGDDGKLIRNGFARDSQGWAWMNADGYFESVTDWVKADAWYYTVNGYRQENAWFKDTKGWCYVGSDGRMVRNGWAKDSAGWCWLGSDGHPVKDIWLTSGGYWYYVKPNGYMAADTWVKDTVDWCYVDSDGRMVRNDWVKDSKGWCWLGNSGHPAKDTWVESDGDWYYVKPSGYMAADTWVKDTVDWCYVGSDGRMIRNGWAKDSKGWCWLGSNGRLLRSGWAEDSKGWCWFDKSGHWVKKRWIAYKGEWYYLKSNGYMASNEWAEDSQGWMWMAGTGKITKSCWIKDGRYWYYLKSNGYMATGKQTINGKVYWFNSSGKWIE